MALKWFGGRIAAKAAEASKVAIDQTMAKCVVDAKSDHPWQNRTGTAEGSIRIVDTAEPDGARIVGRWGSADVNYFIFLELGTAHMEPMPALRPAADKEYPLLKARVRAAYAGEAMLP